MQQKQTPDRTKEEQTTSQHTGSVDQRKQVAMNDDA
jgi:hypothetical protein